MTGHMKDVNSKYTHFTELQQTQNFSEERNAKSSRNFLWMTFVLQPYDRFLNINYLTDGNAVNKIK